MGANSTQARGVLVFVAAFVLLAAGIAAGGSAVLILCAIAALSGSLVLFAKCKTWDQEED